MAAFPRGADNASRLQRLLWRDKAALDALHRLGLSDATIRRFGLGLTEPYLSRVTGSITERALTFPVTIPGGAGMTRWACLPIDGVTVNRSDPAGWGAGPSRSYMPGARSAAGPLVIVTDPMELWLLSQTLGGRVSDASIVCRSHPQGMPEEWRNPGFVAAWSEVIVATRNDPQGDEIAALFACTDDRGIRRVEFASGTGWSELVGLRTPASALEQMILDAAPWSRQLPEVGGVADGVGDFGSDPVAIDGAFVGGHLYWPITVERRGFAEGGRGVELQQRYVVQVLRSDGRLLDVGPLPAPPGTPLSARVHALSDGVRVRSAPLVGRFGTWRWQSIAGFIRARHSGEAPEHRPLAALLGDIEQRLRSAVWLPKPDDYAVLALFVAATFVHRVFDVMPILFANGPRASGKSELGQAMAALSANGVVAGRITAAGLVRLLAESRGLLVLDDLERIGSGAGVDDISQLLKVSYKQSTATRVTPGRDGRIEVLDFFSPKMITNISGADEVLLSRMISVSTAPLPAGVAAPARDMGDVAGLRDELHVWAMTSAAALSEIYRDLTGSVRGRMDEIVAPLLSIARLAGDAGLERRLLAGTSSEAPAAVERVETVLRRIVDCLLEKEKVGEVAMPRLQLELALAGVTRMPSAETIGRMLLSIGARSPTSPVTRRRLRGELVRVYAIGPSDRALRLDAPEPFAFCSGPCAECRYVAACPVALPGLMERRQVAAP